MLSVGRDLKQFMKVRLVRCFINAKGFFLFVFIAVAEYIFLSKELN